MKMCVVPNCNNIVHSSIDDIVCISCEQAATAAPEKSLRHNTGKVQLREISPSFILGIGEVLTKSREKYAEGNWMGATNFSTPYESLQRHLQAFWAGEEFDKETGESHLLHAATNLMFLHFHQSSENGIDDRLFKKGKK